MKCIKNLTTNNIRRVKDDVAMNYVNLGTWKYISKTEWKMSKKLRINSSSKVKGKGQKKNLTPQSKETSK